MRLINAHKLELESFDDDSAVPPYIILSHTWGADEVTLQDFQKRREQSKQKQGYAKIQETCALAIKTYHVDYAWIDTCCIDKRSSAELSEAINSMYRWYQNAEVCVAYLEDLSGDIDARFEERFRGCRWFTRGWCLQELIAPKAMYFYCNNWTRFGSRKGLSNSIQLRTGISQELLRGNCELSDYSIAQRMSWAANRQTTRTEDRAYSLLGIFDVNMPLLYGEGTKAFLRLQEEILKESEDQSIFAWRSSLAVDEDTTTGLLALSPDDFALAGNISVSGEAMLRKEITLNNKGIKFEAAMLYRDRDDQQDRWVLLLDVTENPGEVTGIFVIQVQPNVFRRMKPGYLKRLDARFVDLHFSHQRKDWLDIFEPHTVCNYLLYMPKVERNSLFTASVESAHMVSGGMRFMPRRGTEIPYYRVLNAYPGTLWFSEMGSFVSRERTSFAGYLELRFDIGTGQETEPIILACGKDGRGHGWCHLSSSTSRTSWDITSRIEAFHTRKVAYDAIMAEGHPYRTHVIPITPKGTGRPSGYLCSAFVRYHPIAHTHMWQIHFSVDKGERVYEK